MTPLLPRGVRLHDDRVRGVPVLLGPERAVILDAIGQAILAEVDGLRTTAEIVSNLAQKYNAPAAEIAADVTAFLADLHSQRLLDDADA
ncbi:MAG: pyrroloquinoline quinone biosynthesis peptide chaperone PqqD [Pseudomonadota bacterium]